MKQDELQRVEEEALDADGDLALYQGQPFTGIGFDPFPDGSGVGYEVHYLDGLPHGLKRGWYEADRLEYEIACFKGLKHGEEKHWFADGALKSRTVYEYGVKLESKTWDQQGQLVSEFAISPESTNYAIWQARKQKGW